MKIVIDKNIPFIEGVMDSYSEVVYKKGDEICREDLVNADAMIIRTRTKCGESLLAGTPVKLIATATIGTDHIDLDYCREQGIRVENAAGCNAGGVMDYVFSALYGIASRKSMRLDGLTMGIVGVGNVGRRVEKMAKLLGFNVLRCDPPRAAAEGQLHFCSLDELLAASHIVTMHVPLDQGTRGMADEAFFNKMRPGAIFINAARGEVVRGYALKDARPKLGAIILDTWENEPYIDTELLKMVDIATPHIAGYSYQGKQNGTIMAVNAVARFFGIEPLIGFSLSDATGKHEAVRLDVTGKSQGEIAALFQYNYPIFTDDFMFRMNPGDFEKLRSEYNYRIEFYVD